MKFFADPETPEGHIPDLVAQYPDPIVALLTGRVQQLQGHRLHQRKKKVFKGHRVLKERSVKGKAIQNKTHLQRSISLYL